MYIVCTLEYLCIFRQIKIYFDVDIEFLAKFTDKGTLANLACASDN